MKEKLILAIEAERQRFLNHGHDVEEHDIVLSYLKTGKTTKNPQGYDMLDAVMNDFKTVCSDYEITE